MSSLSFLDSDDFTIKQGTSGALLCHDLQYVSLVLFYSTHCVYCQKLIPIFKQLPQLIVGCQFAEINISVNKRILEMSHQTITPIKYVPLIILYVNGIPYMEYKGPYDINEIRKFIMETYAMIEKNISFNKSNTTTYPNKEHPNVHHNPAHKRIPAYSLGEPLAGDEQRCYLTVAEMQGGR